MKYGAQPLPYHVTSEEGAIGKPNRQPSQKVPTAWDKNFQPVFSHQRPGKL